MKYRVLHIDTVNRVIAEKTVSSLDDMQALVGGLIERAMTLGNGDDVFVDEEGLLKGYKTAFLIKGAVQPFMGNAFVIGPPDRDGENTDCKTSATELKALIRWLP